MKFRSFESINIFCYNKNYSINSNEQLLIENVMSIADTPGFKNENLTKPEETKIISAGGGLARPDTIGSQIVCDSLVRH